MYLYGGGMNNHTMAKAGHTFLASLGKTRLRPGGIEASDWLISQAYFNSSTSMLEIACNMATTSIEIASKYGCKIIAVDMDDQALANAKNNVEKAQLAQLIQITKANALSLPFPDNTFDVVLNEAMLTMYADKAKEKLIKEYYRVLKPGGILLTHDIMKINNDVNKDKLVDAVRSNVSPMFKQDWYNLFINMGFSSVITKSGKMSLLSPLGLIKDEGIFRTVKIIKNGLKNKENRARFLSMFRFFRENKNNLNYIACCSRK
ncbi:SAM-dependent methyltransferase [Proteus myxofaciens ATCC 19692]|uniref:SAM-dependent methyltransferase n=2 Tax=Proteus myxofaciens TaxID=184072 RepID=A0A198GKY2_9GAMM|nr:SAM-dependent methyltransferase [Proteus myxofaciens ATCC 19692]